MNKRYLLYLDALRLNRWPRSLAIIPGYIAAVVLIDKGFSIINIESVLRLVLAFFLTWIISTANYIINEITDAPYDAFHPQKKNRPLVKNEISKVKLLILYALMFVFATLISFLLYNNNFSLSLFTLAIAGLLYNVPPIRVKDIPILDSTIESANNPIRFLIGWHILSHQLAPITLLLSWWAFGNFLMVGKRVAEKKFLTESESSGYRKSLKRYSLPMLIGFMFFNAGVFVLTFTIFAINSNLKTLLFALPFILYYLSMFIKKSTQDIDGAEEPERLLKDPYFAIYTIFLGIIFILAYIVRGYV
jgi:4-hydroxybenzoate polyprenyltransferase